MKARLLADGEPIRCPLRGGCDPLPCGGGGLFVDALVFGGMPAFFFVVGEGDILPAACHWQPGGHHGDDQGVFADDGDVHEDFLIGMFVLGDDAADVGEGPVATFGFRRRCWVAAMERG